MKIFNPIFNSRLPFPIASGFVRAIRTAISIALSGIIVSISDGSIIKEITIIPAGYEIIVLTTLSTFFVGVDKWLRERGLLEEAEVPISIASED